MADVREMRIFSAEQIIVQDELPKILKDFTKEIIRKNPEDIIKFGRQYFEQLLKENGYFDDNLDKLQTDSTKAFIKKVDGSIHDHYYISGVIGDPYDSKARLAVHKKTGIERAVKIVEKSTLGSLKEYAEYVKQVSLVSSLDHPNIVKYFEYYETSTQFFFVSEYLKGGDLWNAVMNFGGQYTEAIAATVIK